MNRRTLIAGVSVLAVLAVLFVGGYFLLADRDGAVSNNASPTSSPADPRSEIEQAYLRFWEVYARASLELKPELMDEVAMGGALDVLKSQIDQQRNKNQPVRVRVEHNYQIVFPIPRQPEDVASVDDRYINHSVRLDPKTMDPIEADPNTPTHDTYTLRKVDGTWKVAEIIEQ